MSSIQYTIRNIPEPVDKVLRDRARLSGASFNKTVIKTLEQATLKPKSVVDQLDWFIGSGANMSKEERRAEEEAFAWLDSLPSEIETFDD